MKITRHSPTITFNTDAAAPAPPMDGKLSYRAFKAKQFPFDDVQFDKAFRLHERIEDSLRRANLYMTQEMRFFPSLVKALDNPALRVDVGRDMVYGIALSTISVASETLRGTMEQLCYMAVQDKVTVDQFETVVGRVESNVVAVFQQIVYALRGIALDFPSGSDGEDRGYETMMELSQRVSALCEDVSRPVPSPA